LVQQLGKWPGTNEVPGSLAMSSDQVRCIALRFSVPRELGARNECEGIAKDFVCDWAEESAEREAVLQRLSSFAIQSLLYVEFLMW
jgi:hypothetical protein